MPWSLLPRVPQGCRLMGLYRSAAASSRHTISETTTERQRKTEESQAFDCHGCHMSRLLTVYGKELAFQPNYQDS